MNGWKTTPRQSISGAVCFAIDAIFSVFFRRSSPLMTRNLASVVPLRLDLGRAREDRRHDAIEELVVQLDAALLEGLGEGA